MRPPKFATTELDEMARLFHAGVSAVEIGKVYRLTGRAVLYHLAKRGLRYRRRAPPKKRVAIEMRRAQVHLLRGQGLTVRQMAARIGIGRVTFQRWMQRHMRDVYVQLTRESRARRCKPPVLRPPLRPRRIRDLYVGGHSIVAIARHYRRHPQTIWRVLEGLGVPRRSRHERSPMWLRASRETRGRGR